MYPETKGVPLEEMDSIFGEGHSPVIFTGHTLRILLWYPGVRENDPLPTSPADFFRSPHRLPVSSPSTNADTGITAHSGWFSRVFPGQKPRSRDDDVYIPLRNVEEREIDEEDEDYEMLEPTTKPQAAHSQP